MSTLAKARQLVAPGRHLAPVEGLGGDQQRPASPISMRALIGSGPKAENSGQKTQPAFSVPSAAM